MARISIVTAFYNEEQNLPVFQQRVRSTVAMLGLSYQIVLIDDHSSDGSSAIARQWAREDPSVCYLRLSRNCGTHAALSAGLQEVRGDCAVLLAADLQDPPETIPALLEHWHGGAQVVWASRAERQGETWTTKLFAGLYYRLMRHFALPDMPIRGADFLLMDRKVVAAYNAIPEKNTSFLALVLWMGFRQTTIGYVKQARLAGRSKWSFSKKLKLLIDSLVSFSVAPIRLMSLAGMTVSLLGLLYAGVVVINAVAGRPVEGWSSLMLAILLLGGFQLLMMGLLGEYLWRTYDESRGRPRYLIEDLVRDRLAEETSADRAA